MPAFWLRKLILACFLETIFFHVAVEYTDLHQANLCDVCSTATIPLYAQMADLFGRRYVMLSAVAIFLLGTGLCGGARSAGMLIAGRAIMGAGGGGMTMLIDVIVSDLLPLNQRGQFMGIVFFGVNIGTSLGPFVGGQVVASANWRWVFWLNLPITGAASLVLIAFLHTPWRRSETVLQAFKKIDFIGNAILMASAVSILFSLSYAGTRYAWSDWHIIMPLVLGFAGLILFFFTQASPRLCPYPVMPLRIFNNRTTIASFALSFIYMLLSLWRLYFLPVYFQSSLGSSSARSGVQMLPSVLMLLPSVLISGVLVKKMSRFLAIHFAGFGIMLVGHGLLTILDQHSTTAAWVLIQIVVAFGSGLVITALLPAIQASLTEADTAVAVGAWGFVRAFGVVWGISIPAAVFNNRFEALAGEITDPAARAQFSGGNAYQGANAQLISSFGGETTEQIINVYAKSIQRTWQVGIGFAAFAFLLVFIERNLKLRDTLDTEYGLQEKTDSEHMSEKGLGAVLGDEKPKDEVEAVQKGGA